MHTGLPNRILFVDHLSQQIRSRGGEQQVVALIVIDIERLRNINESFCHRGGDELLTAIAQRLSHAFHGKDYLARISSNGFRVIVRGMKHAAGFAYLVENEVFFCFSQPFVVSGRELRASVKVGIALFPVDGMNADILFGNINPLVCSGQSGAGVRDAQAADRRCAIPYIPERPLLIACKLSKSGRREWERDVRWRGCRARA